MSQDNYWKRRAFGTELSRRRLLGGVAVTGVGAASLALVGCGDDDDDSSSGGNTPAATSGSASPTAAASASAVAKQKGGTARFISSNNTYDTFDVDRSRFSPIGVLFGYTNLGVMQWDNYAAGKIGGGLAEKVEQPDKQTFVFSVRPNVFWHNKAPVNGRAATADDIAQFILRNKGGKTIDGVDDPNFYRKASFQTVDKVEVVDAKTVKVTTVKPDPFFLNVLAGTYTKVQAPEAIKAFEKDYANLSADKIIGTGAFVLTEFAAEGKLTLTRNEKFYQQVNADAIKYIPLFTDQAAQQAAFEQKQVDAFAPTANAVLDDLNKRYTGKITELKAFSANPQAGKCINPPRYGSSALRRARTRLTGASFPPPRSSRSVTSTPASLSPSASHCRSGLRATTAPTRKPLRTSPSPT